jgi:hypothetical protein
MVEIEEVRADEPKKNDDSAASKPPPDKDAEGWERLMGDDLILKVKLLWGFVCCTQWGSVLYLQFFFSLHNLGDM